MAGYSTKAHAKVNIFLKITGNALHPNGKTYHTLLSRFVQVEELYDTIRFEPCEVDRFTIEGCDGIALEQNSIYRAYKALNLHTGDLELLDFFYRHKVVVEKRIPQGAGLGGGSSDAAAFLRLAKEACNLLIDTDALASIGATIGADVPFFVYNYPSANVSGFGEIVTPFDETPPRLRIETPPIHCDTAAVYQAYDTIAKKMRQSMIDYNKWVTIDSKQILYNAESPEVLNDLFAPALSVYPKLSSFSKEHHGWFLSGSGSTLFALA